MNMRKVQHDVQVEEWKQKIIECRNSGLPVIRWCKENNVKENRYYYWLNIIRHETLLKSKQTREQTKGMTVFAQVNEQPSIDMPDKSSSDVCAVIRIAGISVEIQNGASQETIGAIMQSLKATC